jgi:hypothetical protein
LSLAARPQPSASTPPAGVFDSGVGGLSARSEHVTKSLAGNVVTVRHDQVLDTARRKAFPDQSMLGLNPAQPSSSLFHHRLRSS